MRGILRPLVWTVVIAAGSAAATSADEWQFGTARVDITPERPLRLSGYSNRDRPYEGVDAPIYARTLAMRDSSGSLTIFTSVELLGVTDAMRTSVLQKVEELEVAADRFALCATHTHTAPHVRGVAPNLFTPRMEVAEIEAMNVYTDEVIDKIAESIRQAIGDLAPGKIYLGSSEVGFAANRRVLADGRWTGFGVQPDGPKDHSLPVLLVKSPEGKIRSIVSNYACHATTLGGEYNRLGGDWPGIASSELESRHEGCVALTLIGCGADANPEPRGSLELAKQHGVALADAVDDAAGGELVEITSPPTASYGFAGLAPVRPSIAELTLRLASPNGHIRQHAQDMLAVLEDFGRIPETYPCPIQVLRFGDELAMVLLGGEVVIDYTLRLREILSDTVPADRLWVTAYANDVFAYVASERMRNEGGYEFDFSMYFYNQPGPWEAGTEALLLGRVKDLFNQPEGEGNLSPEAALRSMVPGEGLEVELVAAEPLIADPVNIAFGPDGKLWVAEMGDYPHGPDGEGAPDGRVRYLEDKDGDGRFDTSTLVLKDLKFTTGVHPWRNGVLVSSTPEIFFAELKPDGSVVRHPILTHFAVGNPQHVVTGFSMGLDNWLYFCGDELGTAKSAKTGQSIRLAGRDGRFRPDTGEVDAAAGVTQHVRTRNDWGDWFGGANYCPLWHYVIEDLYVRRNPHVATPKPWQDLYSGFYPQVFPKSRIVDRFNDLFTAGRFTSACSPSPYRDELLGDGEFLFACEPVHNLVHRAVAVRDGLEFRAHRPSTEMESEFLASTDPWSRPVRAITGPDGAVYIADMYRMVIEHPQWIPDAWKARIDVRSGHEKGRIYRVFPKDRRPTRPMLPRLSEDSPEQLVARLESSNGWERDMAQQLLVNGKHTDIANPIRNIARSSQNPKARLNALGTLAGLEALSSDDCIHALRDAHPAVRAFACRLAEGQLPGSEELLKAVVQLADDPEITVRFQAVQSLGESADPRASLAIAKAALADIDNEWVRTAALAASIHHPEVVLRSILAEGTPSDARSAMVDGLLATSIGFQGAQGVRLILAEILPADADATEPWQMAALGGLLDALGRRSTDLASWSAENSTESDRTRLEAIFDRARRIAPDAETAVADRVAALRLLGRGPSLQEEDRATLASLLNPNQPIEVQSAAVAELGQLVAADVPDRFLSAWRSLGPSVRSQAVTVLLSRPEWSQLLLAAIEQGRAAPSDLGVSQQQELMNHANAAVQRTAKKLFESGSSANRAEVLAQYQSALTLEGDAGRGRELFARHCAACHRFQGIGNAVAANLEALRDRSPGNLLLGVLDPNRAVEAQFVSYVIETTNGRVLSGMVLNETSGSLTLARPDGTTEKVLRIDIEQMSSSGKSFMPEGFEKELSPQQLADLFAFLQRNEPTASK